MFRELLVAEFSPYGALSSSQLDALEGHYQILTHWNQRLNLTRILNIEEAVRLHYCESLFLALSLPPGPLRIVDVGSGAGFPGIPVAILRSESSVDLVESHQRKAVFLREATRGLSNVRVLACRAEDCQNGYDWMISRAVRAGEIFKTWLAPNFALLSADALNIPGARSERTPWGENRALFHVKHG